MVRYAHLVKCNFFSILEEAIRSPNAVKPIHVQYPVFFVHIFWKAETGITPRLCKKDICHICL